MYSPEVTIVAAGTSALVLGLGLGFRLGKLYGMKLGIAARDFAESFGIGKQGMQAGVGAPIGGAATPPYNLPQQAALNQIVSRGGGGGGGSGGYGGNYGHFSSMSDLYQYCVNTGMSHADAQKVIDYELQKRQQRALYAQALGNQKKSIP